jgi:hypothetical protein
MPFFKFLQEIFSQHRFIQRIKLLFPLGDSINLCCPSFHFFHLTFTLKRIILGFI